MQQKKIVLTGEEKIEKEKKKWRWGRKKWKRVKENGGGEEK